VRLGALVQDNSGVARLEVTIRHKYSVLGKMTTGFGKAAPSMMRVRWRVPPKAVAPLRFCARAYDLAGNASRISCESLILRP